MGEKIKQTPQDVNPNAEIAAALLHVGPEQENDSLIELYETHQSREDQQIDTVEVTVPRDGVRALYLNELLIGYEDSAVDFYEKTLDDIKKLPENMKPDILVLSGLLQGDFKYLNKSKRAKVLPELTSMDQQFKFARKMIEKAQELGTPVIYNMSNDDHRIAEDYTVEVFRKMQGYAKSMDGMNWANVDKMRQHPKWKTHLHFQKTKVFPYCLKSGRRLYTAEEMKGLTDGKIDIDEYFVLFSAERAKENGQRVKKAHAQWLKEQEAMQIKSDSDETSFIVTDDFNMHTKTKGREYTDHIRHFMTFSPEPMYQNHMKAPLDAVAQMRNLREDVPDMLITQNNLEEVGVGNQNAWVISSGGLIRAKNYLKSSGRKSNVNGDLSKRLIATRRRIPEPSAAIYERTDDDRFIWTIFNDVLNHKSDSLPERTTIAELCDLQTGSITARPDILAKYLDYIRTRAIGERATALFFGGDMLHGRNYPHFPSESQQTGLMSMDSQEEFNQRMFQESFSDMSKEELKGIDRVLVQPGNHEWNSGTLKWHGYSFTTYMRDLFGRMYARAGFSDQEIDQKVKSHEAFLTPNGEYATGYTGVEYFGDIGVLIQHYLMERGGKGSGGDAPVYQTHHFANGASDVLNSVDIHMAGHWHHPQFGMFGNKLGVVGGSIAGISDYELKRGYRPTISGTMMHIGGGLPTQVEFISEKALHDYEIKHGNFSKKALKNEGYKDDEGFDPYKDGIFAPDSHFAKSALQKKILREMRDASQRTRKLAELRP